jgi:hypothetical protein
VRRSRRSHLVSFGNDHNVGGPGMRGGKKIAAQWTKDLRFRLNEWRGPSEHQYQYEMSLTPPLVSQLNSADAANAPAAASPFLAHDRSAWLNKQGKCGVIKLLFTPYLIGKRVITLRSVDHHSPCYQTLTHSLTHSSILSILTLPHLPGRRRAAPKLRARALLKVKQRSKTKRGHKFRPAGCPLAKFEKNRINQ